MPSPGQGARSSTTSLGRQSATGAARRRGDLKISEPILIPSPDPSPSEQSRGFDEHCQQHTMTTATDGTWPRRSRPSSMHLRPGSQGDRGVISPLDPTRASVGNSLLQSTTSITPSKTSLKQQRKSGFRATIRSFFGSQRRRSSVGHDRGYHLSDPGNLVPINEKTNVRHVTRPPSQPTTAVTQVSPLGSHSPFAPFECEHGGNNEQSSNRRRRNTLPSIIFTEQEVQIIRAAVDRSKAGQGSKTMEPRDRLAEMSNSLKRRSRSAGALTELADAQVRTPAHWRQSIIEDPLPTYKSKTGHGASQGGARLHLSTSSRSLRPVQMFDFGLFADVNNSVSLEDRVNTLELKVIDFEYAIARLQGSDLLTPVSRPPKRRSMHEVFAEHAPAVPIRSITGREHAFLSSPAASSSDSNRDDQPRKFHRSSQTSTIRPSHGGQYSPQRSAAPSSNSISIKKDDFERLMSLIKQEQTAREQLETQVSELQKQLAHAAGQPVQHATPDSDSVHEMPLSTRARTLHRTPAFPWRSRVIPQETSRFSVSDAEEESEITDDGYHDVFETPQKSKLAFEASQVSPTVEIF